MLVVTTRSVVASESIDEQISAIQSAPAEQRLELMNKFKMKLAKMNFDERSKAIESIQSQASATHTPMNENQQTGIQSQRIMHLQSKNSESLNQVQNIKRQQFSIHMESHIAQGSGSGTKMKQGK